MKRKPLHIDWDELEAAFENRSEDLVHYLDLVTGEVVLEGQGEEAPADDDDAREDEAAMRPAVMRPDNTRLYVVPFSDDDELGWAEAFVELPDLAADVREKLSAVLDGESAVAFRDALRSEDETRESWFRYRSDCLHQAIDAWLAEHQVNPVKPPPWR
ncbi:MAG TPA: UPF0158 family protein [Candidatus Polarisedimenticolaceae bacterium]